MKKAAAVSILVVTTLVVGVGYLLYLDAAKRSRPAVVESPPEKAPVPVVESPVIVEVPDTEPPKPVPEVVTEFVPDPEPIPVPDRYAMLVIASADGRELEAQILDVTAKTAFIRREDKIIFEIPLDRLNASSLGVVDAWRGAYAHLVTPEQKAFLAGPKIKPEVAAHSVDDTVPETLADDDNPTGPFVKDRIPGVAWEPVKEMTDEFDGRRVDEDKWQIEPKGNGWNWIGRAPGLFLADNVSVEDGKLKVTVSKLDKPETINGNEFLYQGAIVRSHHAGELGWFFECKMKANATEMSSTFWLMTKGHTIKKLEMDIQECVGTISDNADPWVNGWDHIFHSNLIHRKNQHNPEPVQIQKGLKLKKENHKRFYTYGAWWKSEREVLFYLDGEHVYTLVPEVDWDVPAYIQMAIETYDWNPVPERGSMVERGSLEQRQTQYEWVRTWRAVTSQ